MMTTEEVAELLATCAGFDNRKPSKAGLVMWTEVAALSGWTLAEASRAVSRHYAASREWIMPVDITAMIATMRAEARAALPWCGDCDDRVTRRVVVPSEDTVERLGPCPTCHPSRVTTAVPALTAGRQQRRPELTGGTR